MESSLFMRSAATSFAAHMVLAAGLVLTEVHPFDYASPEPIAVDIVSPAEVPQAREAPPEPQKPPTDAFDIPSDKPPAETKAAAVPAQSEQQPAQASPPPAAPARQTTPPPSQQAALQPPPQPQSAPPPSYQAPEPDISVKYGVLLGLPATGIGDGGGAAEATKADIPAMDTAEFRHHLKSCSKLPASVSSGDNIRIVLRVPFTTDGKIAAPPALIEASASAKGPVLMKSAIEALVACQPYTMLPADKYSEWKVLDLSFTPSDFVGG